MGHLNLAGSKRHGRQWRLLDLVSAALFLIVFVFFLLVFTPLGDSLAASGSRSLALSNAADPRQRERLLAVVDSAGHPAAEVEACMADAADHMPCEDQRRKIRFSRDMNYDRERHCPAPGDEPLCLVPPPDGYRIPVSWPESLRKVGGLEISRKIKFLFLKLYCFIAFVGCDGFWGFFWVKWRPFFSSFSGD